MRYLKKSELLNRLHSFKIQFVHYFHGKVSNYRVFHIFAQYVQKILPFLFSQHVTALTYYFSDILCNCN